MKRVLFSTQVILFGLFNLTLLATILQLLGESNPLTKLEAKNPVYNNIEEYDPSLSRLNTIEKLENYCDSLFLESSFTSNPDEVKKDYTDIVSSVIRMRFYHGYSYYGFSSNYIALLISRATLPGLGSVVVPDDILKYPFAACSQQAIVMMEVLRSKGFETRKVSFQGKTTGHFCFEVYYEGGWHFYDTNMEPDVNVLNSYGRPGIAYLVSHMDILLKAYRRYPASEIVDVFPTYSYGEVNKFPAPRAIIFQKFTKFLSYTIWSFFLFFYLLVRRKYLRLSNSTHVRNSRIYFPQPETGTPSSYYPGFTAPGT